MKKTLKLKKQKAAQGLNEVAVPQAGNYGAVATSALSMGQAGFAVGGPYGAAAGAVIGAGVGLLQKKKQDKAAKDAKAQNEYIRASRAYDGMDATINQGMQQYATGGQIEQTKPIEVEKDELIFRKVGGKFKLKADFKGGKPHSKGGEDYQAAEGDIIFPGKQRKKVLAHLKRNNHTALEGMRLKLPADTNLEGEAAGGVASIPGLASTINPTYNYLPKTLPGFLGAGENQLGISPEMADAGFSASGGRMRSGLGEYDYSQDVLPQASSASATGSWTPEDVAGKTPGAGLDMGNAMQYASLANNLIQGLTPAEKVQEDYYNPQLVSYQDRSQGLRNQTMQTRNSQFGAARNSSGGNVQVQRALQAAADNTRMNKLQQIDTQEQLRADQVEQTNVQLKNQAKMVNTQKKDQYADIQSRNNAGKQAYLDAAATQVSSLGNVKEQQKYQKSLDAKKDQYDQDYLGYLNNTTQFQIDESTKNATFNPAAPGRFPRSPRTTIQTVDEKGKIKLKTTRKS